MIKFSMTVPHREVNQKNNIRNSNRTKARIAGMLFLIGAAQFLMLVTVAESIYPKYSVRNNFLSDLGVVHQSA
jgi:hypothetical protein